MTPTTCRTPHGTPAAPASYRLCIPYLPPTHLHYFTSPAASRLIGNDAFRLKVWFVTPSEAGSAEGAAIPRVGAADEGVPPEGEHELTPP